MKKGRHRRFEEARAFKRRSDGLDAILAPDDTEPCVECGAPPGHDHAAWCLAGEVEDEDEDEEADDLRP